MSADKKRKFDDAGFSSGQSKAFVPYSRSMAAFGRARRYNPPNGYGYMFRKTGSDSKTLYGSSYAAATAAQKANRKAHRYYGRGGLWSSAKSAWRRLPRPIRRAVVDYGTDKVSSYLTGRGAYTGRGALQSVLTKQASQSAATALARLGGRKIGGIAKDIANYTDPLWVGRKLFASKSYSTNPKVLQRNAALLKKYGHTLKPKTKISTAFKFSGSGAYTGTY